MSEVWGLSHLQVSILQDKKLAVSSWETLYLQQSYLASKEGSSMPLPTAGGIGAALSTSLFVVPSQKEKNSWCNCWSPVFTFLQLHGPRDKGQCLCMAESLPPELVAGVVGVYVPCSSSCWKFRQAMLPQAYPPFFQFWSVFLWWMDNQGWQCPAGYSNTS